MKQKIVMKVSMMNDPMCRSKAMKAAVSIPGVISASLEGSDEDQLIVVGEGVDPVKLTTLLRKKMQFTDLVSTLLRKKMRFTDLVSITVVEEKETEDVEKKTEETKPSIETVVCPTTWAYQYGGPQPPYYVYDDPNRDNCCIM